MEVRTLCLAQQSGGTGSALADKTATCCFRGEVLRGRSRKARQGASGHPRRATILPVRDMTRTGDDEDGSKADSCRRIWRRSANGLAKAEAARLPQSAMHCRRVQELEVLPAPGKAFLRAVVQRAKMPAREDEPASRLPCYRRPSRRQRGRATLIKMIRRGRACRQVIDFQ